MSSASQWIKASRSGDSGNCVEMRSREGPVEVRDTKDQGQGPTLRLTSAQFAAWCAGARRGEFDHLA
jgi:Domain of unknown function (DUF397)